MIFEATIKPEDRAAFQIDYFDSTFAREMERNTRRAGVTSGVSIGLLCAMFVFRDGLLAAVIVGLAVGIVATICMPYVLKDMQEKQLRKLRASTSGKGVAERARFAVSEEGIRVSSNEVDSLWKWSAVKRVRLTNGRIFLYIAADQAVIIPTASLGGATGEEILREVSLRLPNIAVEEA